MREVLIGTGMNEETRRRFYPQPPAYYKFTSHQCDHVISVNVSEKLLILSIFPADLKQKQCFVLKWQYFILFSRNLLHDVSRQNRDVSRQNLWNILWVQNLGITCEIDKNCHKISKA